MFINTNKIPSQSARKHLANQVYNIGCYNRFTRGRENNLMAKVKRKYEVQTNKFNKLCKTPSTKSPHTYNVHLIHHLNLTNHQLAKPINCLS
jgi:hypothetical protein